MARFLGSTTNWLGEEILFRFASAELKAQLSVAELEKFHLSGGIYYHISRLEQQCPITSVDLDINTFFDNTEFRAVTPVVLSSSPVFYSFLVFVHDIVRPHSGVGTTLREVAMKMHAIKNPRRVVSQIRKDCVKCRLLVKKTLELEMGNHPAARTVMAPPFHSIMIDVVYKFRAKSYKRSRQSFDVYALIIVCLLSSATSILVLEGLETQDVVMAIERHSAKYGVPAHIFCDAGSQLVNLENTSYSIRDVALRLHSDLGLNVHVSNPKSHEERGRVEAKVRILRDILNRLSIDCSHALTTISWETLFSKICNQLDQLPISRSPASQADDLGFSIITPNRLKLGRNNNRALDHSIVLDPSTDIDLLETCRKVQNLWYQLFIDRVHFLIPKPEKWSKTDPIEPDDIVVFVLKDANLPKLYKWSLGRVLRASKRSLQIEYVATGGKGKLFVTRSPRQVSKVFSPDELPINTAKYFENVIRNLP